MKCLLTTLLITMLCNVSVTSVAQRATVSGFHKLDTVVVKPPYYSRKDTLKMCQAYLKRLAHATKDSELILLQVDGQPVYSKEEFPRTMAAEQQRRYWDFFHTENSMVLADHALDMAVREAKTAVRNANGKPDGVILDRDSLWFPNNPRITIYLDGYSVKSATIELSGESSKPLNFASDHVFTSVKTILLCEEHPKNSMAIMEVDVYDGVKSYRMVANRRWHVR